MVCDLCQRESREIIRVEDWQVCQWCISNKVLDHALEIRANIKKLQKAVLNTSLDHREDEQRKKRAEVRLATVYTELEAALKELAAITADSNKSLEDSLAAVETLHEYKSTEDAKTRKARG
jgi:uncharacterized membrane protein YukC